MKRLLYLIILIVLFSCNYFESKKVSEDEVYNTHLKTFNWNAVDSYPTFKSCDSILEKEASKNCFQKVLISNVTHYLEQQQLQVDTIVSDTITLNLEVDKSGFLSVKAITLKPETALQIPKIDSLLRQSLKTIPKLYPAIKRGQQVKTAFQLPVIIEVNGI